MTYANDSKKYNRIPVAFIECDMDFCANVYGTSPCTASIGVTGDDKCYNTYATCQDKQNFDKTVKTYRFCEQNADLPIGLSAIPLIKSISFASQQITPNKGLGYRGSVSIVFTDSPWPDTEIDPYFRERENANQGTFWPKFKARNPFYENRILRVRRGYLKSGFNIDDCLDSVYVIEQINGLSRNDEVTITAKDILKLADDKKALFPTPSAGVLSADISNSATSFTLNPAGIGSTYQASGKVAISGELLSYTRSGDTFTVTRGASNTVAEEHKSGDTVQQVGIFDNEKIQDVIYELLTNYANIDTAYIDKTAWDTEATTYLAGVWNTEVAEPTGVNTLLTELTEQGTCRIWWDELEQLIQFRAVKPLPDDLPIYSEDLHFLNNTVDIKVDTTKRISTVLIYFSQKKPTEKLDDKKNYELRVATPNAEAISALQYGSNIIKTIFSRWFKKTSMGRVNALSDALLKTYGTPPQEAEFSLSPRYQLKVGDLFLMQSRKLPTITGAVASVPMEVIFAQPTANDDIKYKAQEVSTAIPTGLTFNIVFADDVYLDVDLYDVFVSEYGTPEPWSIINFEVLDGVLITSSSTSTYALTNPDTWPIGCTINLVNHGVIAGRGGDGGDGIKFVTDWSTSTAATNGSDGGNAILTEYAIDIDNTDGAIQGGAGGSGAGGSVLVTDSSLIYFYFVGGGGGSGGYPLGAAGDAGSATSIGTGINEIRNGHDGNAADDVAAHHVTTVLGGIQGTGFVFTNGSVAIAGDGGDTNASVTPSATGDVAQIVGTLPAGSISYLFSPSSGGNRGDALHGDSFVTWSGVGVIYGDLV